MSDEVPIGSEQSVYDARQSIKIKPMEYLDDMRVKDPQGTIDYLFERKEFYKKQFPLIMAKIRGLVKECEAERERSSSYKKMAAKWKQKSQKELAMKNWWKIACCATVVGFITLVTIMMFVTQIMSVTSPKHDVKIPTSGTTLNTPNHILGSVNIINGDQQGSGTIISQGSDYAYLLTVAHNFKGVIGGPFWVYYADGTYTKATLLAIDREKDLALAKVDVKTIIGRSYVPETMTRGSVLSGCGYTEGQGPNYRTLTYNSSYKNEKNRWLWEMTVNNGPFYAGDSGSGVFLDDACVGVTGLRNAGDSKKLYAIPLLEVVEFLKVHANNENECGDWRLKPPVVVMNGDAPPMWAPKPNVPINIPNNTDRLIRDLQKEINSIKAKIAFTPSIDLRRPSEIPDR